MIKTPQRKIKFPKGFLFGSATAGHQIEGGNFSSDWHQFEKIPGKINNNDNADMAANSWNDWQKDIELLKKTNQNAYRFSIEWARVEPKKNFFDQKAIDHYKQQLQALKKANIKTMVTLFHFVLPQWVSREGGFENKQTIIYFADFCEKIAQELGELVDFWATINEPQTYVLMGYTTGEHAPGKMNFFTGLKVARNLNRAHILAYKKMRLITSNPVGIVENNALWEPLYNNFLTIQFTRFINFLATIFFIAPIAKHIDFFGINYYFKVKVQLHKPRFHFISKKKSDFGWSINQDGLYHIIRENLIWRKPIYITENGVADKLDKHRPKFIKDALFYIHKAIAKGADVRGYFHWTLMDNFEWAQGYSAKFGLFTIDRKIKHSAKIYADLIKNYQSD